MTKDETARPKCCAIILDRGLVWRPANLCSRPGVIQRDGELYCRQHDPITAQERRRKSQEGWAAENAAKRRHWRLECAAPDLLAALKAVVQIAGQDTPEFAAAHAAIAKAEGDDNG